MDCVVFLVFLVIVCPRIMAETFVVGDAYGWTGGLDYQDWAKDKRFRVGDKLVFKYPAKAHNVFQVNGTEFERCTVPPENNALATGNDKIVLSNSGSKWYICGVSDHCLNGGLKLFITVAKKCRKSKKAKKAKKKRKRSSTSGSRTTYEQLWLVSFTALVMMDFLLF